MFKEVVVVEGRDDTRRLKEIYPNILTFETGGSAINKEKLAQIRDLQKKRGVIIFTDPDFPGEKIRNIVMQAVPECKHAHLSKKEATRAHRRGLGVEHASDEAIKQALVNLVTPTTGQEALIETEFLMNLNLIGHAGSSSRRKKLSKALGIGHVNGKQLQKRLQIFGISKAQIEEALKDD